VCGVCVVCVCVMCVRVCVMCVVCVWKYAHVKNGQIKSDIIFKGTVLVEDTPLCSKYSDKIIQHVLSDTNIYIGLFFVIILLLATSFGLKRPSPGQYLKET